MAAKPAAPQASMKSSGNTAQGSRSKAPDRFPVLDTPRYFTEVSVPGYSVAKSVAKIKKHEQKRRQRDAIEREISAPAVAPIVVAQGKRPRRDEKARPQDGAATIQFEL